MVNFIIYTYIFICIFAYIFKKKQGLAKAIVLKMATMVISKNIQLIKNIFYLYIYNTLPKDRNQR